MFREQNYSLCFFACLKHVGLASFFFSNISFGYIIFFGHFFQTAYSQQPEAKLPLNQSSESSKADVETGLVAHFKFDSLADNQLVNNKYVVRVDGVTLTTDRFGKEKCAYQFDGTKAALSARVNDFPSYRSPQSFSWWFFTSELQTYKAENGAGNMIVVADAEGGSGLQFGFRAPGYNTLGLDTWMWGGGTTLEVRPPAVNSWHHCVYTFDGTAHCFFLDGKEAATSTVVPQKGAPTQIMFGNYPTGDQFFRGKMDDVLIYNRALSQHEIELLYHATQ